MGLRVERHFGGHRGHIFAVAIAEFFAGNFLHAVKGEQVAGDLGVASVGPEARLVVVAEFVEEAPVACFAQLGHVDRVLGAIEVALNRVARMHPADGDLGVGDDTLGRATVLPSCEPVTGLDGLRPSFHEFRSFGVGKLADMLGRHGDDHLVANHFRPGGRGEAAVFPFGPGRLTEREVGGFDGTDDFDADLVAGFAVLVVTRHLDVNRAAERVGEFDDALV